ncbi:MAG: hypothetical protein V4687_12720 [Bacteroidota bacterium]
MKKIITLLFIAAGIAVQAQTPSAELVNYLTFANLKSEVKSDYGTLDNPILSGAFMNISDRAAMETQMRKLQNSYRWPDGSALDFSKRKSMRNKDGIVDMYTMGNGKDTVKIFVDPYHTSAAYFVPKGLVALTSPLLGKVLAPVVKMSEEFYAAQDASTLKESTQQLVGAIQKQIGTALFVDADVLTPIVSDKELDKDLGGYLIKTYVVSKFLAHAKNMKDPKDFATKKMKDNFIKFSARYPEVKSGSLKDTLK